MRETGKLSGLIDNYISKQKEESRNYLGASSIGSECTRSLWYQYNNYPARPFTAKNIRTFAIGKYLEGMILKCLKDIGLDLIVDYPCSDKELPLFQGHADALWLEKGKPHAIIEIKTARDSSYKIFQNKGLLLWSERYYAQMQAYLGMSGLQKGYILVLNKNSSELLDEAVYFDEIYYESLRGKVNHILKSTDVPKRINESPLYELCRTCRYKEICRE